MLGSMGRGMPRQQLTGGEVGHGRGGGTRPCPGAGSLRYKSDSGNRAGEKQQPRPLLLPPAASHSCQALMMKVQVLTALPLLLAQLSLALAQAEAWGGSLERQPGGWGPPEAPRPAGSGGDTLLGQGTEGSHPLVGAGEVLAEPPQAPRAPSKARGRGQQGPPSQLRRHPPQPSRSRSLGLSQHLKGHGKFNADTVSASPARGALTGTSPSPGCRLWSEDQSGHGLHLPACPAALLPRHPAPALPEALGLRRLPGAVHLQAARGHLRPEGRLLAER